MIHAAFRPAAAALLLAGLAMPSAVRAQDDAVPSTGVFKTGEDLFPLCTSAKADEVEYCDWYVMAAHDMIKFYGDTGTGGDKICLPVGSKEVAVREAVVNYWRNRPEARRYSAASTIYNALSERYGCGDTVGEE